MLFMLFKFKYKTGVFMLFMLFKFKYKTGVCYSCYSSLNIKLGYVIHVIQV